MSDREIEIWDRAYRLGFRAGMLEKRRYDLAMLQYSWAIQGGVNIALSRGNISLEEFTAIVESNEEVNDGG